MREYGDAQLFGQSRTLRVKQLLGLNGSEYWRPWPIFAEYRSATLPDPNDYPPRNILTAAVTQQQAASPAARTRAHDLRTRFGRCNA